MPYKNKEEEKKKRKEWRTKNKAKIYLYNLLYNATHPEMVEKSNKKWYENNKELAKKRSSEWKKDHPEKTKENRRKEYINNPEKSKGHWRKRRAILNGVSGGHYTHDEFVDLCNKYGNKCLCCGRDDVKLTADHIIPISKHGSDEISNIQPLCKSCNSRKGIGCTDYRR